MIKFIFHSEIKIKRALFLVCLFSLPVFTGCKKKSTLPDYTSPAINSEYRNVGASAKELLTATKPKLIIEVNYVKGYALQSASIDNLKSFLQNYLNKPGGIEVVQREIPPVTKDTFSVADIVQLEKNHRTSFSGENQVAIHFLVTNTAFTEANVLGIAYYNTSLCLFGKTIFNNSGGIGQASRVKVESTVLTHEVGHILGLTNLGTRMVTPHNDPAHISHCNNSSCLMYYATETTDALGILITGNMPDLDQNCKNDLKANGGK